MTSNVGAKAISKQDNVGFRPRPTDASAEEADERDYKEMKSRLTEQLRKSFRPEFLNRIDEIIIFRSLTKDEVKRIVDIVIGDLRDRLVDRKVGLRVTTAAKDRILELGWDPDYGARPLRAHYPEGSREPHRKTHPRESLSRRLRGGRGRPGWRDSRGVSGWSEGRAGQGYGRSRALVRRSEHNRRRTFQRRPGVLNRTLLAHNRGRKVDSLKPVGAIGIYECQF